LHDEDVIFVLPQNLIEEAKTRAPLGIEHMHLAHARIHHQANGQWQI
jgi:hypothetical protein